MQMDSVLSLRVSDSETPLDSGRKKRRKIEAESSRSSEIAGAEVKWRSDSAQRTYSVKLVEALQRASQSAPTSGPPARSTGGRATRDVADRVLAMAAKGRTRWSRAILASRLRLSRLRRHRKAKRPSSSCSMPRRKSLPPAVAEDRRRRMPAVEKRVKVLSRLVPGCEGIPVTNLLEEVGDYIAALEMQVRAMAALTEILSGSARAPAPPPSSLA